MSDQEKFTAIIYFHGVGQQSRYEELSRLLEALDDYALVQADDRLERLEAKVESSRTDLSDNNVGYVTFKRDEKEYRFYEVYWAPLTATGTSGWSVFRWFMGHIFTPLLIWNSRWNSHQRLRISYLYSLWETLHPDSTEFIPLKNLMDRYQQFCDDALRGGKLKGTFQEFIAYLQTEADDELVPLTYQWRAYMRHKEFWNFFIFLSIGYIVAIVPIITMLRVLYLSFSGLSLENFLRNDPFVLAFYVILLCLLPVPSLIARFLRDYGGDVQLWATYEETNEKSVKRKEILKRGLESMTHVLNHEGCERVIILGHSLGTTIAFDTLLSIGRHNRALNENKVVGDTAPALDAQMMQEQGRGGGMPLPLSLSKTKQAIDMSKIEYFVTMGSPIDKIHYFFESKRGLYRPYELIVDALRGDIGLPPFMLDTGIPNFRWINFWSQEDYVSGALYTPNPREFKLREQKVNNVLIKSYAFPSPAGSHVGYFRHNVVIGLLYRLIFRRADRESSIVLKKVLQEKPQLQRQRLRNALLLGTWSLLFAILFDILGWVLLYQIFSVIFMGVLAMIVIVTLISATRGALHPFTREVE